MDCTGQQLLPSLELKFFIRIPHFIFRISKMVGSVCRSAVHSHYLVQNNCIEPEVNCANFEELENKLKEALVELSSGQLIIMFLQKQLNTTLVLGSQHNLQYETPLLHKEVVNQQTMSNVAGSQPTQIFLLVMQVFLVRRN